MEPRIQFAKTEDGVSIAYYVIGDGLPYVLVQMGDQLHQNRPARHFATV